MYCTFAKKKLLETRCGYGGQCANKAIIFLLPDPSQLRAATKYFDYFTVHEYDDFTLPCIPSHEDVKVSLLKVRGREKEPNQQCANPKKKSNHRIRTTT